MPTWLHACFLLPSATKLTEPTSLFNPGVRELGDLRALVIDFRCRLTLHLGFECACFRRLLDTRDGTSPLRGRLLRGTLGAIDARSASCPRRLVHVRAHTVSPIEDRFVRQLVSGWAEVNVVLRIIRKCTAEPSRSQSRRPTHSKEPWCWERSIRRAMYGEVLRLPASTALPLPTDPIA
jgi:hypothetical protein